MYNLTNLTSAQNIYDVAVYANEVTRGTFWGLIIIAIFIISTLGLSYKYTSASAISVAAFGCAVLSIFAIYMGVVSTFFAITFFLVAGGAVFYNAMSK